MLEFSAFKFLAHGSRSFACGDLAVQKQLRTLRRLEFEWSLCLESICLGHHGLRRCILSKSEPEFLACPLQHFRKLDDLVSGIPEELRPRIALLTGSTRVAERRSILEGLASGEIAIAVGTHALITDGVDFKNLGLAVVDEQHR